MDRLESQRLQLEDNVAKLRKSLQHWRTWDAEYEGLKEELTRSDDLLTEDDCIHISDELSGELVNKQEIYELFGVGKGQIRPNHQVASLIDRRLDYVQQNITSISKQLRLLEDQLEQIYEEQEQGGENGTSALPLTEILEELDDDGNVISTKVSQPESATAQILETLRKAGLTDMDPDSQKTEQVASGSNSETQPRKGFVPSATATGSNSTTTDSASSEAAGVASSAKKSVKFAEDIEESAAPATFQYPSRMPPTATPNPSLLRGSFNSNDRVIEVDDEDEMIGVTPIIPEDESPEDARLRREMLQYSLNEVGSVVAELDLDEDYSDDDDEDIMDLDEEASNSEISEDEDEHGRSLRKGVTKSYRQQMLELEEKLMARMIENVGPEPDETSPFIDPEELRKLVIRDDSQMPSSKAGESSSKKGVRFADDLDISEAQSADSQLPTPDQATHKAAPIADSVLERTSSNVAQAPLEHGKPARVSRFKQAKAAQAPPAVPEAREEDRPILSNSVVERPAASSSAAVPMPTDELDPEVQQRQLASEYYRMRNNMVRQQGGFKMTEEDTDRPLMEERDGKVKKVSRFKAARLR